MANGFAAGGQLTTTTDGAYLLSPSVCPLPFLCGFFAVIMEVPTSGDWWALRDQGLSVCLGRLLHNLQVQILEV